ncbi:amino acid ABC transporter permease [Enteractinococcus coprophilus]|uniref:Amino acid ABC transporter membrane protein 1 (PAAT family) n=1 Tax=Enteractinococcus coprophilus TaxID=1027633 RepID=A0A542ZYR6_9MICC|nr:amino acid ABC transporter permease [Enteractinococcus coprophilus]TQL65469.1 amino acid ABC transporter membrane protein 1 (PAAT family) [Enteractinococcus coprophilus]
MNYLDALVMHGPRLWDGLLLTLQLTVVSGLLAFVVAVVLGLMAGSTKLLVRLPARIIIEFFRGTSLLVQLMWLFYVLPLFGPSLGAMLVAIFALTLNYGAYGAEAVRASLTSVPQGQWEATAALSMSWPHKMRRIIFPQAWALMLPSLTNLWVHLLKGSSIVYIIGMSEFTFELLQLRRTTDWLFALAIVGLVVYFIIALVLTQLMRLFEARSKYKLGRGPSLKEILSPVLTNKISPADEPAAVAPGGAR